MSILLPDLGAKEFSRRLREALEIDIAEPVVERLWHHYEELRRWSAGLSLIGRGTAETAVERHYAESLAAVPLVEHPSRVVDLGSGAGFPGLVLAAARPDLDVWLVESRQRKALFLEAAGRRASLSCTVLNARVGRSLPEDFPEKIELVTLRAVRLGRDQWSAVTARIPAAGRILRWGGPAAVPVPEGFAVAQERKIEASSRVIELLARTT